MTDPRGSELGIIGRERSLIDHLAKPIHEAAKRRGRWTPLHETWRGSNFDIALEVDGEPTGHIVRVEITLIRFEQFEPVVGPLSAEACEAVER